MFYIIVVLLVAALVGADQLTKYLVIKFLKPVQNVNVWHIGRKKILDLTYVENNGAVFGRFGGQRLLLLLVTIFLMVLCIYLILKNKKRVNLFLISLIMIVAGGIGNMIDRVFRGGLVIDFIEIKLFNFAVFNFADICVTLGVFLMLIYFFFFDKTGSKKTEINEKTEIFKEGTEEGAAKEN